MIELDLLIDIAGGPDNPLTQFGGGVLATLVQSSLMVPVEVIRQRQMIQTGGEGAYTVAHTHNLVRLNVSVNRILSRIPVLVAF